MEQVLQYFSVGMGFVLGVFLFNALRHTLRLPSRILRFPNEKPQLAVAYVGSVLAEYLACYTIGVLIYILN